MITPKQAMLIYLSLLTTPIFTRQNARRAPIGLNSMGAGCERWKIKNNEDKTRAIYFSHRIKPSESLLTLNEENIPFVNSVKYLGVNFEKKLHVDHT
jgi:hypothetical protein